MAGVPSADQFPAYPRSWYLFSSSRQLRPGPLSREMLGRRLVAYRSASGRVAVMDGRCSHLGADLGRGCVVGESIQCPFHHWEYGPDGRCTHIPVTKSIPPSARQAVFPAVERHGYVFFFNGPEALFPLPFFPDCELEDFRIARPFTTVLHCPWYLIGANHFDLQHFLAAHDRRLVSIADVSCPDPFARRARGTFRIAGGSLQDRLTRWFCGDEVTMTVTDWCGTLSFTTAQFRRTCSFGMTLVEPLARDRVQVRVFVFVRHGQRRLARFLLDPMRLWIRRLFIKRFLEADRDLLNGVRYTRHGLIENDAELASYLRWLARISRGLERDEVPRLVG